MEIRFVSGSLLWFLVVEMRFKGTVALLLLIIAKSFRIRKKNTIFTKFYARIRACAPDVCAQSMGENE